MAESTKKKEEKPKRRNLFKLALAEAIKSEKNAARKKNEEKNYLLQFKSESNSSNLNSSKKMPDDLSAVDRKKSELDCDVNTKDHNIEELYSPKSNFQKNDSSCMNHNSNSQQFSSIYPKSSQKVVPSYKSNKQNNYNSDIYHSSHNGSYPNQDFKNQSWVKPCNKFKNTRIKVKDKEEDCFSYSYLNFKNDIEDETSKINHQRSCSELDEPLNNTVNAKGKFRNNIKVTVIHDPDSVPNASSDPSSVLMPSVSNMPVSPVSASNTPISLVSNTSPVSLASNVSSAFSSKSDLETYSNLLSDVTFSKVRDDFSLMNDSVGMLISSNDSFIPPPSEPANSSDNLHLTAEKNGTILQNSKSESTDNRYEAYEAHFALPDPKQLEAISNFITNIVTERSVKSYTADKVVNDLNRLFKDNFAGIVIDCYGSHHSGLAITTSNINIVIKSNVSIKKSFMFEIHRLLSAELEKYHVHHYEEGATAYKSKINFTHTDTGISCELAYLGKKQDNYLNMGKFLVAMCYKDSRVKSLIISAKVWAEHLNINDVEDGKLHPIGFTLLVIHFLQHCENPVLPIYSSEKEDMKSLPRNDSSIGTLWLQFLWYYSFTFNWVEDVLTVTSENRVSKKFKVWENYWIAIEDPFTLKNIAETVVNKDVADYIKTCFESTYNYFLNGPEDIPSFDNGENQEGCTESSGSQLEFSFNDCIVKQEENVCETCYDMDDNCEECKKKIYVQPMASMPKMTDEFLEVVKKALLTVYRNYILTDEEVSQRRCFVKKLEREIQKIYPDAQMSLFGSSANGFGFKKSDLDICLRFKSRKLKAVNVLKELRNLLRRDKNFVNVIAIFNAQIPILKFRSQSHGWRGDISLDNVLAVHNSKLLYTYSLIDERCKVLGCALKLIAKKALIAEVTEKALSSYSYLIMVIHFLQQTNPPVLPVLQDSQFRRGNFELDHIVDNCNVWFCSDTNVIKETFKTENDTPVEQLFLDLLDYYCSFASDQVITIRQKDLLPHCEKMRLARLFNIQDPFLVTKNLGCVVSPTKARETRNVLNKARQLFRTPTKEMPANLENYFFSIMNLTGSYKEEALCDLCGKFGHNQKDCRQSVFPFPKRNYYQHFLHKQQYTNQNNIFKWKQMNRKPFMGKL